MFVAWRDLRFAKGRFALMGSVIVLITVLVGLLSGLTAGLGRENTSAVTGLSADHLAFSAPAEGKNVSFADSRVGEETWRRWADVPGVRSAEPLGIATTKAESADGRRTAALSAFGARPGSGIAPEGVGEGRAVLSAKAAEELRVAAGDRLALAGRELLVAAVGGEASYSHTPVIWTSLADWQALTGGPPDAARAEADGGNAAGRQGTQRNAPGDRPGDGQPEQHATVVALTTGPGATDPGAADPGVTDPAAELAAADERLGTSTVALDDSVRAIGSFTSENGSLQLMRGFLFAISALVIGAFFTVWTIQRSGDVAVLKALGASTGYLLRDALGQAVVLLVLGTTAGTAIASAAGAAVAGSVPFLLEPATVLIPALVMTALGAIGAALSVRRITSVDPLTALGSAR